MVLIITEFDDLSTREVLEWLNFWNVRFICVKPETKIEVKNIYISENGELCFIIKKDDNQIIHSHNIRAYWYRRGYISLTLPSLESINDILIKNRVFSHLSSERNSVLDLLYYILEKKQSLCSFFKREINKVTTLQMAKECGLSIPLTAVFSNREQLNDFKNVNKNIVTKGIQDVMYAYYEGEYYTNYTELLSDTFINNSPPTFFPTLFQKQVDKKYELRIFYLDGQCYSMAIFSQKDKQTEIDFRKYNDEFPNRTVPFKLPKAIYYSIKQLMNNLNLNTGSIDMIVSNSNEYIFLEVNPVGQFGMVSYPCNYYLEKRIAEFLTSNNHE